MQTQTEMEQARRAYAKELLTKVGANDDRLETAFASVPREAFLDPGPWPIFTGTGQYAPTPDANPARLYADILIGIDPARGLNNGQPSFHAYLLAQTKPRPGEHIVHIGTGWGYYTAIMAELVGPTGRVTGVEFDEGLAARAKANLACYPNVEIIAGDGASTPFDPADVIYVNAGATRPAESWLSGLTDNGRLLLPLTTDKNFTTMEPELTRFRGATFLICRVGDAFRAKWISPVAIFPCAGARDEASEKALATALANGRWREVTRLYRGADLPDERVFLKAPGWCLAYS